MSEQLELISSAFKVIETQRPKQACCRCDRYRAGTSTFKTHCTQLWRSGALADVVTGNMQTICRYTASQKYTVVREWS
ncbi:IS66 family transposase zinc-finger binding domain-containing protein [Escherichia coli]